MTAGRQAVEYFFELALFLFVATGFIAVATTGKLDTPSVLLVAAALGLRGLAFLGLSQLRLDAATVRLATIGYIFFYVADYFLISGNFVSATGHLLFYVLITKLFSAETNRDYLYLGVMAFMEMLLAAILTINATFLGLFIVFLLFGIGTFTAFEIRRGYAIAVQTNARPARITGEAPAFLRSLGFTAIFVTLAVLAAGAVLFFFIPRVSTGYLSNLAPQSQSISGFADRVTLGEIGAIKRSTEVVMHVKITDGPRNLPVLRWRGKAFAFFDGHTWSDNTGSRILDRNVAGDFVLPRENYIPVGRESLHYSVLLEPIGANALFLASEPETVSGRFRMLELDETDSVINRENNYAGLRYDAVSNLAVPTPPRLRAASQDYPAGIAGLFRALPRMDPNIKKLAEEITQRAPTPYDKAIFIEQYLRTKYGYTLEMTATGSDPIADFLFRVRKGHCEYFASAMTVMVRSLGIPAREVSGFLGGEYNDINQQYVVRAGDAHTWVEVYFPGYGWMTFDPTPAAGTTGERDLSSLTKYLDAARTFWSDWVVSFDFSRQFIMFRQMDRTSRQVTTDTRQYLRERYNALRDRLWDYHRFFKRHPRALPVLIGLCVLAALLLPFSGRIGSRAVFLWRLARSRARVRSGRANIGDVTVVYERFLVLMSRRGLRREPATTPHQFAEQVDEPLVREFTVAFEEARYGGATDRLPDLYRLLDKLGSARGSLQVHSRNHRE